MTPVIAYGCYLWLSGWKRTRDTLNGCWQRFFCTMKKKHILFLLPKRERRRRMRRLLQKRWLNENLLWPTQTLRKSKRIPKNWSNSRQRQIHLKFWRRFHYWKFLRLIKSRSLCRIMRIQPQNFCMCRWKAMGFCILSWCLISLPCHRNCYRIQGFWQNFLASWIRKNIPSRHWQPWKTRFSVIFLCITIPIIATRRIIALLWP